MRKEKYFIILGVIFLMFLPACSLKWYEAIGRGDIVENTSNDKVDVEVELGLIIVPVTIRGVGYRFLLDTGAPFSISEKVQQHFNFDIISKGYIVDTDKNRKKVNYVQVDTVFVGNTVFADQTAFVANFESNPKIKCLNIDGIIGSNLMRYCNWQIDYQNQEITITKTSPSEMGTIAIPFHIDNQFNILLDLQVGEVVIRNLTVDYGSNGSLLLSQNVFNTLKDKGIIKNSLSINGFVQSGLVGKTVKTKSETTYLDTLKTGNLIIEDVRVRSGGSGLIGKEILSRYIVTIDWEHQQLLFIEVDSVEIDHETFGFSIGFSEDEKLYVQSVVEGSSSYNEGIEPSSLILKLDSLDFSENNNFCDYINYMIKVSDSVTLVIKKPDGLTRSVFLKKSVLGKNLKQSQH